MGQRLMQQNPNDKIRMTNVRNAFSFGHLSCEFDSSFDFRHSIFAILACFNFLLIASCSKPVAVAPQPAAHRIASVTPAGTDLLVGMGFSDQIVGVSRFDDDREGTAGKPKIGDYQSIDWEKLAALNVNFLLVQFAGDRFPADLRQRCEDRHIRLVNVQLNNIADVMGELNNLSADLGHPEWGAKAVSDLQRDLDEIRIQTAGKPRVKAVIVTSDNEIDLAGPGTFLDDLLTVAGGENAAGPDTKPYFAVDRERLAQMAPEVVIQL